MSPPQRIAPQGQLDVVMARLDAHQESVAKIAANLTGIYDSYPTPVVDHHALTFHGFRAASLPGCLCTYSTTDI